MRPPFLSHKRTDSVGLSILHQELKTRGVGGWRDVESLGLGSPTRRTIRQAIWRRTGGFIWFGTVDSLSSEPVCDLEIPTALRRRRFGRQYPLVPLFVDLSPSDERVVEALGPRRAKQLRDLNGLVRAPREPDGEFLANAARRYVAESVKRVFRRRHRMSVQISGEREPNFSHDLSLDWRDLLDAGRVTEEHQLAAVRERLSSLRDSVQACGPHPKVTVEVNLRLPLAALVGWELGANTQIDLNVVQRSGASTILVTPALGGALGLPTPVVQAFDRAGPVVVAVSVVKGLHETVARHAYDVGASSTIHLHIPDALDGGGIQRVAAWVVEELAQLNDAGASKQLLVLGPSALSVCIGCLAAGTGKTTVPFWDGATGYSGGIEIG